MQILVKSRRRLRVPLPRQPLLAHSHSLFGGWWLGRETWVLGVSLLLSACGGGGGGGGALTVGAQAESAQVARLGTDCADPIGCGTVQLLVDEAPFASVEGFSRQLGTMVKQAGAPLLDGERFYGSALAIGSGVRLYVLGGRVYEATDGLSFQRRGDVGGLVLDPDEPSVTVTRYAPPGSSSVVYLAAYPDRTVRANIAHSSDGLNFTPLNGGQPVVGRAADTFNQLMFDPIRQGFRLSTRTDFGTAGGEGEVRGTRTMVNGDIFARPLDWATVSEWALSPRYASSERQIYGKTEFIERGVYFALAMVYKGAGDLSEGLEDHVRRHDRDVVDVHLLTSRDGVAWDLHWIDRDLPLIPRGGDGAFDKDLIVPAAQVITTSDAHQLYYSGADERHNIANRHWGISRASVARDRLVCQQAHDGTATFKPITVRQDFVGVNLDTSKGRAEFWLTKSGDPNDYGPVTVEGQDAVLRIPYSRFTRADGASLQAAAGQQLTLRVRLVDARLCAVAM